MAYYNRNREQIEWGRLVDGYGRRFLSELGLSFDQLARMVNNDGVNPLINLLKKSPAEFVRAAVSTNGGNRVSLDGVSRVIILAQMLVYDNQGGPEADNKPKALRRHWYAYFKQFAQLFTQAIDPDTDFDDPTFNIQWSGRQSKIYGEFVDTKIVTYRNLWIEDASRMIDADSSVQLIEGLRIIMCVEKDSLFSDFTAAAKALGASAVISGKGKNSKAATELMLRKLGWSIDSNPFQDDQVLFLHLSDYDYDGQAVIGPTFAEQATRYLENIQEARVGVNPEQVEEATGNAWDASYSVKLTNTGYQEWAQEKALFWGVCKSCGTEHWVQGYQEDNHYISETPCQNCGGDMEVNDRDAAHGFEVESLRSSDYYRAMVNALLKVVDLDTIIQHLRLACVPSSYTIVDRFAREHLYANEDYQRINRAIETLRQAQSAFEQEIVAQITPAVDETIENTQYEWAILEDDPDAENFREHVIDAGRRGYGYPWRPFDAEVRNQFIFDRITDQGDLQQNVAGIQMGNMDDLIARVTEELSGE